MTWSPVASLEEVPSGQTRVVQHNGEAVALFNIDGSIYACSEVCPHAGGPLHLGFLRGTQVACPWHGWAFELNCEESAPRDGVLRYEVKVEGDQILLAGVPKPTL